MAQTPEERKESIRVATSQWQKTDYGRACAVEYQRTYREKKEMNTIPQSRKEVLRWLAKDNGLDVALIIPSFIPEGCEQVWDSVNQKYCLIKHKGIIRRYKPKSIPMEEEVIVEEAVEAPVEAENAPVEATETPEAEEVA